MVIALIIPILEAEEIVFDKARATEQLEAAKEKLGERLENNEMLSTDESEKIAEQLQTLEQQRKQLDEES